MSPGPELIEATMPSRRSPTSHLEYLDESTIERNHLLLVGGGPRSVIQANSEIVFMLRYREHFEELVRLGARYNMSTTIVEKQEEFGMGRAYCEGQTGMMNSGVEDDISFPIPMPSNYGNQELLNHLMSYSSRYDRYFKEKKSQYYQEVKKVNIPGAVMFKRSVGPMSATSDGQLEHERAYLLRRTVGEEEYATFAMTKMMAEVLLPFYHLRIAPSTSVRSIKIHEFKKPLAVLEKEGQMGLEYLEADQIRLNTGTSTRNPISNAMVRKLTFCEPMNANNFEEFCYHNDLLDKDGLLKPGSKVISGGLGLSGLDQVSVLDKVMGLFEEDESQLLGYKVTEQAQRKYQGAITLISRRPGKPCYPRQTNVVEWQQETPVLGNSKHLHALFLHDYGQEVYNVWTDILNATVARAMNLTPHESTCISSSTEEILQSQFEGTQHFLEYRRRAGIEEKKGNMQRKEYLLKEATKTLYGAWRQAALCLIFGFGVVEDLDEATTEMEEFAPLTWKGRQVWMIHRSQVTSFTNPEFASKNENMTYFKNWEEIMRHVTSSPVEIHSMFQALVESGIARYEKASYSDLKASGAGNQIELHGTLYDTLLVSPVFERAEDEVTLSLEGSVEPYHSENPAFPKVGKFRRFQNKEGKPISVEDNGLGGKGFNTSLGEGKTSRLGCFAVDLNNRASGVSVASTFTMRRMAIAHLKAAAVHDAERTLDEIYEMGKPTHESFNEEVEKFREYFEEAYEIWSYLEAIKHYAGKDADLYGRLFDLGQTRNIRNETLQNMYESGLLGRQAAEIYQEKLSERPQYRPPSRDSYLDRFVDTTDDEDLYMYTEAFKLAKKHLKQ